MQWQALARKVYEHVVLPPETPTSFPPRPKGVASVYFGKQSMAATQRRSELAKQDPVEVFASYWLAAVCKLHKDCRVQLGFGRAEIEGHFSRSQ